MNQIINGNPLLGCPFCGRQPHLTERGASESERSTTGKIFFLACHCGGYVFHAHQHGYTLEEVASAWNTRTAQDQPEAINPTAQLLARLDAEYGEEEVTAALHRVLKRKQVEAYCGTK